MIKIIYLIGALINLCIIIKTLHWEYKLNLPITLGDLYFTLCCCILSVLVTPLFIFNCKDYVIFNKKDER